jgi:hypothetical protein
MIDDDRLRRLLDAGEIPAPAPELTARTLAAAAPLLAVHARRASLRTAIGPVLAALAPLPMILGLDVLVVRTIHALLASVLPAAVSTFIAMNYALWLGFLLASAYAAVPLLADRQLRATLETGP